MVLFAVTRVTPQLVFNGAVTGLVIGLLAMGIVLVYRSTRVINFAVGNLGLVGGSLFALMVLNYDFPFWVAFGLAMAVGTLWGAVVELTVVRRLFTAPRVVLLVATVGVAQLCQAIIAAYPDIDAAGQRYPVAAATRWDNVLGGAGIAENQLWAILALPLVSALVGWTLTNTRPGHQALAGTRFDGAAPARIWLGVTGVVIAVGLVAVALFASSRNVSNTGLRVTGPQLSIILVVPVLALGLGILLNRTTFGKAVAASADNPDLSRLSGVNPKIVSTFVWTIAGLLSTLSIILLSGQSGSVAGLGNLGPLTLGRAMVAAVLAGMVSFPRALAAGVFIGVVEAILRFNFLDDPGLIDFVVFAGVLIAVHLQTRAARDERVFAFAPKVRPVPDTLRELWWVRHLSHGVIALGIAMAVLLPFVATKSSQHVVYTTIICFAIAAASVTVITGWSGQLSLSQMAFAGLGALTAAALTRGVSMDIWFVQFQAHPLPFVLSIVIATFVVAALAVVVGLGSLRVRGLMLAVTTFVFAIAAQQYLFRLPIFTNGNSSSVPFRRGDLFGLDLSVQRTYYFLCLAVLVVVLTVLSRLRGSGIGRSIIAVRDNPDSAAAYTVSPTRMKLSAFALAGGIAALGGSLLAGLVQSVPFTDRFFLVGDSLRLVGMVVIGGVGSVMGPVLGALWVEGVPNAFGDNELVPLFSSSIGLLLVVMYFPGGLVQIGYAARDSLLDAAQKRLDPEVQTRKVIRSKVSVRPRTRLPAPELALRTTDIRVRFGGNVAVGGVDMEVRGTEIVGLIGTNGAGKSTFMNAVGAYVPSSGRVELAGRDISALSAQARARQGLGRTFQASNLFAELTVRETVQVALEARRRTPFVATAMFLPPSGSIERRRRREADELIDFLGLGRYAGSFISELSTGTRRIVELCGLLAVEAQLLCLDEPTAGVAQREAEAFGPLLVSINRELGSAMLVIEHDMPLIMSMSDRVYCLEAGVVIAEGDPDTVRHDPAVVASYLGTDSRAIARSDA